MDQELPPHEKIRFRRDEITDLGTMPSACGVPPLGRASIRRGARWLVRAGFAAGALVLILAAAIYIVGASGIGTEKLRATAESAIEDMAGVQVNVAVGSARLTLDGSSFLALQVSDVSLKTADGKPMADAGLVRFGVRFMPLLSGEVRLTSAKISNARIVTQSMPSGNADWAASLRDEDGLLVPDKVIAAVFGAAHEALDSVRFGALREIALSDVEFVLPESGEVQRVAIGSATVSQAGQGQMQLTADADVDGRAVNLKASAARDARLRRITALEADVELAPKEIAGPATASRIGQLDLHISGAEGDRGTPSRLAATGSIADATLDLGPRGQLQGEVNLRGVLETGSNKIAVEQLQVKTGRSVFDFEGSIGPTPKNGPGQEPSYRYDLVSNGSSLAPDESPEAPLQFIARVAGTYQVRNNRLVADNISLRSGNPGEAIGSVTVDFVDGNAPGMSIAFNVHDMPVAHVKQLWPWFSARNARLWVLDNLFGGRVVDARLQYQVAPGRVGNGVPLSADEVFGRFQVEGSRFDTAGRIPPIRDAVGVVEFRGNDVDIALSSGTVYMPSGRTVAASNGTLKVKNANVPPVIGSLDIDVAGEAPAIVELASYEPINAMRHVGLKPDDISGTVTGNVKADIPLQKGVDSSKLGWLVSLHHKDLALAKPYEGQIVTEAEGTIVVDPMKAVIDTKAKLNGIPAEIDMVEPLEAQGPPASRKVALVIDDKTRNALMPGLSTMLAGTVKVALDKNSDGSQNATADLTNVKLTIPWAGWSKGAGVPADIGFTLKTVGTTTTLSDFDLDGKTFAVDGSIVLNGGSLSSANFNRVQLNRGDDVSVSVKRSSKGYTVNVSGDQLDARSLIKQFTSDVDTATKDTGADAISVSADIGSLVGFHDERLSGLRLDYSASGSRVNGLKVSAAASSGGAISISNTSGGSQRSLTMQSGDAGAILRFLNVYEHMQGGAISLSLAASGNGPLRGQVDARNFVVVNEPKLASIVSTRPAGDSRSLNQAVKADIDTSRVQFERGYAEIDKGAGYLKLDNGVLRGPLIGTTFQGTLYDENNTMNMTGTFMPAYGLNRIFGELPLIGALLGNGRDRGLIGVTYRLKGNANKPDLDINPLSVIAPGIFRTIFEYRQ